MPAQIATSIVIDAPPQQVWDVLVDFDHWPDWNTWFISIKADSLPLKLDVPITFTNRVSDTAKPGTYQVRITTWKPESHEFAWKGGVPGPVSFFLRGHHWFRLAEQEDGKTLFDHGEEAEGLLSGFVPQSMVKDLIPMVERFNGELKRRVEEES